MELRPIMSLATYYRSVPTKLLYSKLLMCQCGQGEWKWREIPIDPRSARPQPRDMAALVALGPDRLLLFGGRGEYSKTLNDLWLLDVSR